MPYPVEAEREVLGAMMESPGALRAVQAGGLKPADFYTRAHQAVARTIFELHGRGVPVDLVSMAEALNGSEVLEPMGGSRYLLDLLRSVSSPATAPYHARIVQDHAGRRRIAEGGHELAAAARNGGDPATLSAFAEQISRDTDVLRGSRPAAESRLVDGAAWILDAPVEAAPVWGSGRSVLWPKGEPLLVTGPDGTGKTTLIRQMGGALLGLWSEVLGFPIEPAVGRVMLLAADRPAQQQRRWRQAFAEDGREALKDRLVVHKGPLAFDPVTDQGAFLRFLVEARCEVLLIDSLGALVSKLASDEVGSVVAQLMSRVVAEGIELVAAFHPRKATENNKKPVTLADIYGSRWITAAAGSVISLWGSPGDPVLELRHLKQPADEVGPFRVMVDGTTGYMSVLDEVDALSLLRTASRGLTAKTVAARLYETAEPSRAEIEKARRKLEGLVPGLAFRKKGEKPSDPLTYFATPPGGVQERADV
jgi:replicative DNA helicase